MQIMKNISGSILAAIVILIMVSLVACGSKPSIKTKPTLPQGQAPNKPTQLPQKTRPLSPTNTPRASEPTANPASTTAATPGNPLAGLSRAAPYPRSTVASAPNWDVQVLEIKRGEEAWKDIQAAHEFAEAAPEGKQYLLVKLHVKSTYSDDTQHSIGSCDFGITGSHLIKYPCAMGMEPAPVLDANVSAGEEAEGWASYLIAQDEKKLILVVNEVFNPAENAVRYIALEDGASIGIPSAVASIKPTSLGLTRNDPAAHTAKLTTPGWELLLTEVVRGEEAWTELQNINPFNDPPAKGMEYIAVKIHVRRIGAVDLAASMDGSSFSNTGSANVVYELPAAMPPDPLLDISLFPGGEYEGWIVLQAARGETGVMLVFKPASDLGDEYQRFILLEP